MTEEAEDIGGGEAQAPTVEDRAREMGWRPKEEFKGDEDRWIDAETFVRRGEEMLPIVKATARKTEEKLSKAEAQIAEMRQTFAEFKRYHSDTEKRAYQRAMKELEREMAEAVEAKDHRAVREIAADMAGLSKDVRTDESGNPLEEPDFKAAFATWQSENPWIKTDPDMAAYAEGVGADLARQGVAPKDQLAEVSRRVRQAFPHKFENPARKAPAAVEGATAPRKAGKTAADLPPEARAQMNRWVKSGLLTEKQFLKDYQW